MMQRVLESQEQRMVVAAQWILLPLIVFLFGGLATVMSWPTFQSAGAVNAVVPLTTAIALFGLGLALSRGIRPSLALWLLLLFLGRLGVAFMYHQLHWAQGKALYDSGLSAYDAFRYDDSAAQVALFGWRNARIASDQWGIVAIYALIYQVFGYNPLFAVLLNTLLGGLTSLLMFHWASLFTAPRVARWIALLTMLNPDSVLYGGELMKEMIVMFLFVLALLAWSLFQVKGKLKGAVIFVGALYGLLETRAVYVPILIGIVGFLLAAEWHRSLRRVWIFLLLGGAIIVLSSAGISNFVRGVNVLSPSFWLNHYESLMTFGATAIAAGKDNAASSIGLRTAVVPSSPATYVFIPFRFVTFFLTPPFWIWGSLPGFVPFVELASLLSWICVPAVLWGLRRLRRMPGGYHIWIPFVIATLFVSVGTPFVDIRYKVALMPLFCLVALIGLEEFRRWRQLYIPYAVVVVALIFGYYALKAFLAG